MPTVSDDFLLAALRMVEYFEDDEMEDFEQREANGESVDGHIYISVNKVRTELLLAFDITSSPEAEERARKYRDQLTQIVAAQRVVPAATIPGTHPFKDGN